jgi:hypothetical protein
MSEVVRRYGIDVVPDLPPFDEWACLGEPMRCAVHGSGDPRCLLGGRPGEWVMDDGLASYGMCAVVMDAEGVVV